MSTVAHRPVVRQRLGGRARCLVCDLWHRFVIFRALTLSTRGFTIFWVFPLSFFVGLVNIQNLSTLWPGLVSCMFAFYGCARLTNDVLS